MGNRLLLQWAELSMPQSCSNLPAQAWLLSMRDLQAEVWVQSCRDTRTGTSPSPVPGVCPSVPPGHRLVLPEPFWEALGKQKEDGFLELLCCHPVGCFSI